MHTVPRVTVLMSVYNGEAYLRQALESILGQTWTDFEFLVVDDCSTDASREIILSCKDPRLHLVTNERNLGLSASLAKGFELARGEFVARMDADDISLPQRLERQVAFMELNPRVAVCGSWIRYVGTGNKIIRYPADSDSIVASLLFNPALAHPAVIMRREFFVRHNLNYDPACRRAQDFNLWTRSFPMISCANLQEVLLLYRLHPDQARYAQQSDQQDTADQVRLSMLRRLGLEPTSDEREIHRAIATCRLTGLDNAFTRIDQWLSKLVEANRIRQVFPEPAFSRTLMQQWLLVGKKSLEQGEWSPAMFTHASIVSASGVGLGQVLAFLLRQAGISRG